MTTGKTDRGYASISTPDGKFRMWLNKPTASGKIICSCGFSLKQKLPFVDAINTLGYVQADKVRLIDEDYSTLILICVQSSDGVFERLIEDIPELMEQYLVGHDDYGL